MKSYWERRFWKLRRTFVLIDLEKCLPLSLFLSHLQWCSNPRNTLSTFSLGCFSVLFFVSTLCMLTFSEIIDCVGWVIMHVLSCCTMAGHCRSSHLRTDHLQLRRLLHPDLRKKSNTFKALEVTIYRKSLWPTWNWGCPMSLGWILHPYQVWISLSPLTEATALLQVPLLPPPVLRHDPFY